MFSSTLVPAETEPLKGGGFCGVLRVGGRGDYVVLEDYWTPTTRLFATGNIAYIKRDTNSSFRSYRDLEDIVVRGVA